MIIYLSFLFTLLFSDDLEIVDKSNLLSTKLDTSQTLSEVDTSSFSIKNTSMDVNSDSIYINNVKNDIFFEQLHESKLTLADAIIYDITLDTIERKYIFNHFLNHLNF